MTLKYEPDWWGVAESQIKELIRASVDKIHNKFDIQPRSLVKRKNPYLYRLRGANSAREFASAIVEAAISSSEETIFGDFFEEVAIIICQNSRGGIKSSAEGIDMEYDTEEGVRTLVQVKSGKNWGNSSQQKALRGNFEKATRILKQGGKVKTVRSIEGICYGGDESKYVHSHERFIGKAFWTEISGWEQVDQALMELLSECATDDLQDARQRLIDKVVDYLQSEGVAENGTVNWVKLLELVSSPSRREIEIHLS